MGLYWWQRSITSGSSKISVKVFLCVNPYLTGTQYWLDFAVIKGARATCLSVQSVDWSTSASHYDILKIDNKQF